MLEALTHSDLAAIHDLAVARARIDANFARTTSTGERDALTARIFQRILTLTAEAQAELRALVRLGCEALDDGDAAGGTRSSSLDWRTLLAAARDPGDTHTPHQLAARMTLDECIERGLLVLRDRRASGEEACPSSS